MGKSKNGYNYGNGYGNGNGNGGGEADAEELNLALAFGGLAVAVSDSLNNNDNNVVGSHNNDFDDLLDVENIASTYQDGTWAAEAVKQHLQGGGNQFSGNQIQNIVDADNANVTYTFQNGAQGGNGGSGGAESTPDVSIVQTNSAVGGIGGTGGEGDGGKGYGKGFIGVGIGKGGNGGPGGNQQTSPTQTNTATVDLPDYTGTGGNGGDALGFSMLVQGAGSGTATGGDYNTTGHNGSDVGSAVSSALAHLEAFNQLIVTGGNAQYASLDASQSAEICPCPENPNDSPDVASDNIAGVARGTAVAVDNAGNNNDNNEVLSFNDEFENLVDAQYATADQLDGTLTHQGVLQVLSGGGNQFEHDQIQNIVDNDTAYTSYNFDNCCDGAVSGGYGGTGYNDGTGGDGGAATGFTMSVYGGAGGAATGGSNNTVGWDGNAVGSAASSSTAHLEAFNHNVIMGANFQSESLTHHQTTTLGDHLDA